MDLKTICTAALLSATLAGGAAAATVTIAFDAEVGTNQVVNDFGDPIGFDSNYVGSTGSGSVTYTFDDADPENTTTVDAFSLDLDLAGFGTTFPNSFDLGDLDPLFGVDVFLDATGALDFFGFAIFDDDAFTLDFEDTIDAPFVFAIELFDFTQDADTGRGQATLEVQTSPIPLPASLPALLLGLGALGLMRSRRATR